MFLDLAHTRLTAFTECKALLIKIYKLSESFPSSEKFGITSQLRRAILSVYLNIAEGSSRITKTEKRRFLEIARSSLVEVDAALDVAIALEYIHGEQIDLGENLIKVFKLLSGLIKSTH